MSTTVTLLQPLNQFAESDTRTPVVGKLQAVVLPVLRIEERGLDQYAMVGTWICTRSNGVQYAVISESAPPVMTGISESSLTTKLADFAGWSLSIGDPRYTAPVPGVSGLPLAPPKQDSCCTFVEDLVVHAFEAAGWDFTWDQHRHNQLMVANWENLWSPPEGVAEAGLARPALVPPTVTAAPEPWSVCQGWGASSGHTFIVVAYHRATDKVLILESRSPYGPSLRGLGPIGQFLASGPPARWWENPAVPTWSAVRAQYSSGIATAQLKVLASTLVWAQSR